MKSRVTVWPVDDSEEDTLQVISSAPDHAHVVRRKGGTVSQGILRPLREGQPIDPAGELVSLKPRDSEPGVFDVTSHSGPPRVASNRYRSGHDRVFGKAKKDNPRKLNPKLN